MNMRARTVRHAIQNKYRDAGELISSHLESRLCIGTHINVEQILYALDVMLNA